MAARLDRRQLTPRETELLGLLAEGLSPQQAALRLGLAGQTVASHLRTARQRLRVTSNAAAVSVARGRGLLSRQTSRCCVRGEAVAVRQATVEERANAG
jgi:two-component system response regulator DesR